MSCRECGCDIPAREAGDGEPYQSVPKAGNAPELAGNVAPLRLFNLPQTALTGDDWYTPAGLFNALGLEFDLDVCAPPGGVPWIPAQCYFTLEQDGLAQPWSGRVWMNPPFSKPGPWVERFLSHGHGIALLPMAKSQWFSVLWASRAAIVALSARQGDFLRDRSGAGPGAMRHGLVLVALGPDCVEAIGRFGRVR